MVFTTKDPELSMAMLGNTGGYGMFSSQLQ